MIKSISKTILGLIFLGVNISVHAELPFNSIYVLAEDKRRSDEECNVDPSRLEDTAKSTLRYNRLSISQNSKADIILYIAHNTITTTGNYCSFNIRVELYKYGSIDLPKRTIFGYHTACLKASIGHYNRNDMQSRMNQTVRELSESCLSEIESM
jgi:acetyltransferase-like isoleucine patch superfamily enzyme